MRKILEALIHISKLERTGLTKFFAVSFGLLERYNEIHFFDRPDR